MKKERIIMQQRNVLFYFVAFFLSVATLLAVAKSVFISIDIDESYAIAQSYRLTLKDKLLADMWEPHQLSAYLSAAFIKVHSWIFHSLDYLVISLRVVGTLLHLGIGFLLYKTVRRMLSRKLGFLMFFVHSNFLSKWIATPEFELMEYWLLLLTGIIFIRCYLDKKSNLWFFLGGVCLVLQMFNYPTMIILFPAYLYGIIKMSRDGKAKTHSLFFTLGALLPGIGFLGYLLSYMSVEQLWESVLHVMADPSHTSRSLGDRLLSFAIEFVWDLLMLFLSYAVCVLITYVGSRYLLKKDLSQRNCCLLGLLVAIAGQSVWQITGCVLFDENQFFFQKRYLFFAIGCFFMYYIIHKEIVRADKILFAFLVVPSVISWCATLLLTNMNVNVSYTKLFPCIFVLICLMDKHLKIKRKYVIHVSLLFILGSLLICKLILIRVTGCLPVTVRANLEKVTQGPLKGTYIQRDEAAAWEQDCELLRNYCTDKDNLFYFGCENLLYLCTEANISVASVQGTAVFDQSFIDYFSEHPEKYPTVVAVDLRYKSTVGYCYSEENQIVEDWILKDFQYTEKIETSTMILYLKRGKLGEE